MAQKKKEYLNRYTSLPIAIDILTKRRITLLNPQTWEDRNDAYYIEKYREKKNIKTLLAICFATRPETFHHWKVFSNGYSGVCIQFDRVKLLKAFPKSEGFRFAMIEYMLVKNVKNPPIANWPFLKRKAFKDEGEFRIIYENKTVEELNKHVDLNLDVINKITLSPWLHSTVADSVKNLIKTISGCEHIKIKHSTLIDNNGWKRAIQ